MVALAAAGLCFLTVINFSMAAPIYNVVDYQAIGDGKTDDTQAFLKAWTAACQDVRQPTKFLIPSGKNFLIKEIRLEGPCRSNIIIQVEGNIIAPNMIWTTEYTNLITIHAIDNLIVYGRGTIDGSGAVWWDCFNRNRCARPYLLGFVNCQNLVVRNISLKNSPNKHLAFDGCSNLTVSGLTITAPGNSPNTDGIIMQACKNVVITGCTIGTGDDCIAILTNTSDADISGITCGPGHGISIGSLGGHNTEAAVERIHVHDSTIFQALTGLRIKTWQGGFGFAGNITFERIRMADVQTPIVIDQEYGATELGGDVAISNVAFRDISGTSTEEVAVKLLCSAAVPCTGLKFQKVQLSRVGINHTVVSASQNAYGTTDGAIIPYIPLESGSKGF